MLLKASIFAFLIHTLLLKMVKFIIDTSLSCFSPFFFLVLCSPNGHLFNKYSSFRIFDFFSPTHILYRKIPSYSHLHVFGCLCFPLILSTSRHKLQPYTMPWVFLDYPAHHRDYTCLDLSNNKIFISRHVLFNEYIFVFSKIPSSGISSLFPCVS